MHKIHIVKLQNPVDKSDREFNFASEDSLNVFCKKVKESQPETQFEGGQYGFTTDTTKKTVRTDMVNDSAEEAFEIFETLVAKAAQEKLGNAGMRALGLATPNIENPFD